jgi:hypothetical protein
VLLYPDVAGGYEGAAFRWAWQVARKARPTGPAEPRAAQISCPHTSGGSGVPASIAAAADRRLFTGTLLITHVGDEELHITRTSGSPAAGDLWPEPSVLARIDATG